MTTTSTSTAIYTLPTIFHSPQLPIARGFQEARPAYETRVDTDVVDEANLIWRNLFELPTSHTSLGAARVDRQQIVLWLNLVSRLGSAVWRVSSASRSEAELTRQQQLAIEQAVVAEYAPIPQVALIYSDRYLDEHVFTLFVTGNQYDDAVMDALLDHEIGLLKRFALGPLTFHYFPYSPNTPQREMVRETAHLIFEDQAWLI